MMPTAPAATTSPMGVAAATDHRSSLTKSLTRLLQHSILQLCNEHIGYTHKLQILGVLCMTIDDEQQEVVVKVNNTLKRVNPPGSGKEGMPYMPSPQSSQQATEVPSNASAGYALANEVVNLSGANDSVRITHSQPQKQPHSAAAMQPPPPLLLPHSQLQSPGSLLGSPDQLSAAAGSRRSHGRKGANPVKVHHVYDEGELISSEEDHENIVTVIPTDPDAALADVAPLSESTPVKATSSPLAGSKAPHADADPRMTGSAKRKPNFKYRVSNTVEAASSAVSQQDTPPTIRALLLAGPRTRSNTDLPRPDTPLSYQGNMDEEEEDLRNRSSSPPPRQGLTLPIVIGPDPNRTFDYASNGNTDGALDFSTNSAHREAAEERNINDDVSNHGSDVTSFDDEELQVLGESPAKRSKSSNNNNNTAESYDENMPHNLALRSYLLNKSDSSQQQSADGSTDGLPTQVSYGGMTYPSNASTPPDDGLTIRYTSTGPITVGANGKSVSQSTLQKVKDIILYDDSSSPSSQKGSRIETGDYMVDSLGYESTNRKRRRRAPDESLTSEEIAEYLGFSSSMANGIFKCKFCNEEVQELTRYLQHTLTMHNAYICHQCGKSFTTKSSLLRHRPIHTGMRRFACSICKKTFYRKDKCKAHIKRHLGANSDPASIERFQKIEPIE